MHRDTGAMGGAYARAFAVFRVNSNTGATYSTITTTIADGTFTTCAASP